MASASATVSATVTVDVVYTGCTSEPDLKYRNATVFTLRDMVLAKYEAFYRESILGLFPPPKSNQVGPALMWTSSILAQIAYTCKTDAQPETKVQSMAMWWLALFCTGGQPSDGVNIEMQELRVKAAQSSLFRRSESEKRVAELKAVCKFARGLANKSLGPKLSASAFIRAFVAELDRIQAALEQDFGIVSEDAACPAAGDEYL